MESGDDPNQSRTFLNRIQQTVGRRYLFKIGAAFLVVIVILLATGYLTFSGVQATVESDTEATLLDSAEAEAESINTLVVDRNADAVYLSGDESVRSGDATAIQSEFERYFDHESDTTHAVHYYNMANGTVEVSTDDDLEGEQVDPDEHSWAVEPEAFTDADDALAFEPDAIGDENLIGFASPVPDQETHAVVITADITERGQLLEEPVEGGATEVYSTETEKVTISGDADSILEEYHLIESIPELGEELEEPRMDETTVESELVDGDDVVVATVPIEEMDWAVTVLAPEDEVYATVYSVRNSVLLLIGIATLGFLAVGGFVSRDVNTSVRTLTTYAEEIEAGNLDVEIATSRADEFGKLSTSFARIRDTMKSQLSTVETRAKEAEDERERAQEARAEAERAQEAAEEAKAEAEGMRDHLVEKAADYQSTISAVAAGDLTRRLDTESESDAMTEIGESLNSMFDDLERMVAQIQDVAQSVEGQSREVTEATQEIEASSTAVASSMEQISAGADEQSESLATAAGEMSELSASIEEITSVTDTVAEQSADAREMGEQGKDAADDAIETMDVIEAKADDTVDEMQRLREEVNQIGEIVELIDDIATETNLLALNASIEAASVNEDGDGFAVVASEVKSLAEETDQATNEVEELISAVERSTASVAEDVQEMQTGVERGRETIDETVETLDRIADRIEAVNDGIQTVNDATTDQASSSEEVAAVVDDVASVSDETASEAQNVSAATEEQASAIEQIATNSQSLADRARALQTQVQSFETDVTPETSHSPAVSVGDD